MKMHSFDDPAPPHSNRDDNNFDEHRSQASQPLPIMRTSAHKHTAHTGDDDEDYDNDHDQGLFSSSPPLLFAVSTFSEWGTESNTTDEGAESDPFCFDDETSRAIIHSKPGLSVKERKDLSAAIVPSPLGVEVVESPPVKSVVCVQENAVDCEVGTVLVVVKSNSLLKRWAKAVWGAVTKIFSRRGGRGCAGGKGGKQS